ncbi:restriction endonuclease subunit S [bacterium]|nr:restriction endonuclease subunit S [bacterium]
MSEAKFKDTEIGKIPADWEVLSLGDLNELIIDYRGKTPKKLGGDWSNIGYRALSAKNIKDGRIVQEEAIRCVDFALYNKWMKDEIQWGDIILTSEAPLGEALFWNSSEKIVLSQRLFSIRVKKNILYPEFFYFFVKSYIYQHELGSRATGTTVLGIRQSELVKTTVLCPPLLEQKAIAKILSDLDSKIELNRQMNKTLEEIGQALFKKWFVDFEFPDKNGNPYKSSGGAMVESELGEIPKGWNVSNIGEVLSLEYGKALKKDNRQFGEVPVYGSNGQIGWHNEKLVNGPGIIVGRKGNPGIVTWIHTDFFPIDTTFYVVPAGVIESLHYLFFDLQRQNLDLVSADSAVPGLNRNIAYMNRIVVPTNNILRKFEKYLKLINIRVHSNFEQNITLKTMRDSLLPRLMSGKIRVKCE